MIKHNTSVQLRTTMSGTILSHYVNPLDYQSIRLTTAVYPGPTTAALGSIFFNLHTLNALFLLEAN